MSTSHFYSNLVCHLNHIIVPYLIFTVLPCLFPLRSMFGLHHPSLPSWNGRQTVSTHSKLLAPRVCTVNNQCILFKSGLPTAALFSCGTTSTQCLVYLRESCSNHKIPKGNVTLTLIASPTLSNSNCRHVFLNIFSILFHEYERCSSLKHNDKMRNGQFNIFSHTLINGNRSKLSSNLPT